MSDAKDRLKDRIRSNTHAHDLLIESAEAGIPEGSRETPRRKKKFTDRYTLQTFYIENELLAEFRRVAGNEKGEKTRIINEALLNYLNKL